MAWIPLGCGTRRRLSGPAPLIRILNSYATEAMRDVDLLDQAGLKQQLAGLSRRLRSVFAASVAQRILPAFTQMNRGGKPDVAGALSDLWAELAAHPVPVSSWNARIQLCETAFPRDDEIKDWTPAIGFACDAVEAVAYALEAWRDDSVQAAVRSAATVLDAVDRVGRPEGLSFYEPTESLHPAVEEEWRRQRRDVRTLQQAGGSDIGELVRRFRAAAVRESADLYRFLNGS